MEFNQFEFFQILPISISPISTSTLKAAINSPNSIKLVNYNGGLPPFTYSISPTLPDPLTIDSTTGYVTGTLTYSLDTATYTVTLTDLARQTTATTVDFSVGLGPGEVSYTTPGTYTFTVPEGVTSISVVTVGGGGGGQAAAAPAIRQGRGQRAHPQAAPLGLVLGLVRPACGEEAATPGSDTHASLA